MKAVNITEQLSSIQRMFIPTSEISETMRENACSFWKNQDKILDAIQTFADTSGPRWTGHDKELLAFLDHCGFRPSQQLCFECMVDAAS